MKISPHSGDSEMQTDILLTTHNNLQLTIGCVEAIYKNSDFPFRLIVSDDSTDLTPEYFERLKKSKDNVVFIHSEIPLKNEKEALNKALNISETELFILMCNSASVEPNWMDVALPLTIQNKKIGVMGIKLLYSTGMIECAGVLVANGAVTNVGLNEPGHRHNYISQVDAVGGAVSLFRRKAIKDGWFDDYYLPWGGYEDIDICLQLRKKGWDVIYCGHGAAYHYTGRTRFLNPDFWSNFMENKGRFTDRWKDLVSRNLKVVAPQF